ncbi:uncharacterized protein conserved in bacteria [Microbacterium testaceum StLB037]|uniref:Uncharacterized protein conserved in bacteria n=1 Tax=Microbacterium testaceum (strain StLB037) TaxID=979556 RepID=E8NCX0_MICTS|nr:DUF3515 family protein [Microbacterium testaceum]BAJ76200.1 uncharacterized protein conserved in bacteria [Microbacterium testaceum StLB037]
MPRSSRTLALLAALTLLPGLAACSATVAMQPAKLANDPACANVEARLPKTISGQERRWTDAQSTAAWGNPASILMTCGLEAPGPTTLPCRTSDGVDWIVDESRAAENKYTLTTYGREPAVQVFLDQGVASSGDVAQALGPLIRDNLAATGAKCTSLSDATPAPEPSPSATP